MGLENTISQKLVDIRNDMIKFKSSNAYGSNMSIVYDVASVTASGTLQNITSITYGKDYQYGFVGSVVVEFVPDIETKISYITWAISGTVDGTNISSLRRSGINWEETQTYLEIDVLTRNAANPYNNLAGVNYGNSMYSISLSYDKYKATYAPSYSLTIAAKSNVPGKLVVRKKQ